MSTLLLIFATALVFAVGGTPLARRLAVRSGIVAQPGAHRTHVGAIPLLGGVAIYGAFLIALVLFADRFFIPQLISIVVGATYVSFLGAWDDRVGLRAGVKLIGQVFGALILIATGVTIELFDQPLLNAAVTLLWIVGITNAMNLLDNMDGLSGGVAAVASAFLVLISAINGQYLVGSLSAALLGASIGFLVYNFNPASIFMGDTGSLFIGFILAAIGIKLRFAAPIAFTWFIPIMVLGLPIFRHDARFYFPPAPRLESVDASRHRSFIASAGGDGNVQARNRPDLVPRRRRAGRAGDVLRAGRQSRQLFYRRGHADCRRGGAVEI